MLVLYCPAKAASKPDEVRGKVVFCNCARWSALRAYDWLLLSYAIAEDGRSGRPARTDLKPGKVRSEGGGTEPTSCCGTEGNLSSSGLVETYSGGRSRANSIASVCVVNIERGRSDGGRNGGERTVDAKVEE